MKITISKGVSKILGIIFLLVFISTLSFFVFKIVGATTVWNAGVNSISISPLNYRTFVVGWCDYGSDDAQFTIYDTNGTDLTGEITVDSEIGSVCAYTMISVEALNSTDFVYAWGDSEATTMNYKFSIYRNTSPVVGPVIIDTGNTIDRNSISVSAFNSTHFVIGWYNETSTTDDYIHFAVYNNSGTLVGNKVTVGNKIGDSSSVSVSAFNSTHFVIGWYNYTNSDVRFSIYKIDGTLVNGPNTVANVGQAVGIGVSVATLNSTHFVIGYQDIANFKTMFAVYTTSGTLVTGPIDADTNNGAEKSVSVSALNSTHFVIGWYNDNPSSRTENAVYTTSGTLIGSTSISVVTGYQAIASNRTTTGIGFCNQNYIHGYSINSTYAGWDSYKPDASTWYGSCGPVVSARVISPTSPVYNMDDVDINATCYVAFGSTITAYWDVYKNNVKQPDWGGSLTVNNNTNTKLTTILKGNFSVGDTVIGEIWCGNEYENTTKGNTSTATYQKAILLMSLSGSNVTYPDSVNIQPSESNSGDSDVNYTFWRNNTLVSSALGTAPSPDTSLLGSGLYVYKLNSSSGANYSANATGVSLTINVSKGPRIADVIFDQTSPITYGTPLTVGCSVNNGTSDGTWILYRNGTDITSLKDTATVYGAGVWNFTCVISGGANWTDASKEEYFTINKGIGTIFSWSLNDSYININQSAKLDVNASKYDRIIAEVQQSNGTSNYTLSVDTNYTFIFDKTVLGELPANATLVNITKLYIEGNNYTATSNTTTLELDYARTFLSNITDSPDPIYNSSEQTFTVTAVWKTTENDFITTGSCVVNVFGTEHSMVWVSDENAWKKIISAAHPSDIYIINVTCSNPSYQTATDTSHTITIQMAGSGGNPGDGGGGGGASQEIEVPVFVTNQTMQLFPPTLTGFISSGKTTVIKGIGTDYSFKLKNIGNKTLNIVVGFKGEVSDWARLASVKKEKQTIEFTNATQNIIQIEPDEVVKFNIEVTVPQLAEQKDYSLLVVFQDQSTGVVVSGQITLRVSKISLWMSYVIDFFKWVKDKLTWIVKISPDGGPIENGLVVKGRFNIPIPVGAIITIGLWYGIFWIVKKQRVFAKDRNIDMVLIILISTVLTFLILWLLPFW